MIDNNEIKVTGENVLELGAGTGLAGLVCGRKHAKFVVVSDYQKVVLENLKYNITLNNLDSNVKCLKLDWRSCVGDLNLLDNTKDPSHGHQDLGYSQHDHQDLGQAPPNELIYQQQKEAYLNTPEDEELLKTTNWKLVIAADCIFDTSHSEMVPRVAKNYLSQDKDARFHVLLPHRLKFKREIELFETNMVRFGWELEYSHWVEKHTLTFRYYIYKIQYN